MIVFDIETDGLDPSTIHILVAKDLDTGDIHKVYTKDQWLRFLRIHGSKVFIGHNIINFDIPVLKKLWSKGPSKFIDTFVVSRLMNYKRFNTHSLEEWGEYLGFPKTEYKGPWDNLTQDMEDYCVNDVLVTEKIFLKQRAFIFDRRFSKALRIEHNIAEVCREMESNGFFFNRSEGEKLLDSILKDMKELEKEFDRVFGAKLVEVKRLKYRLKKDGTPYSSVYKAISHYPKAEIKGDELICYDYKPFDPASPKQRLDVLWDAGWKPVEKTKGHLKAEREGDTEKLKKFEKYGWTTSEKNLETLPPTAPSVAKRLVEWITLDARRSSLVEWLGIVKPDGRIHGKFWHIGSWTHRMSHSNPNQANIPSVFSGEPKNSVEEIKQKYDNRIRALWCVPEGSLQVGTDASGIQLRILAHYMAELAPEETEPFIEAIVSGDKSKGTDIHTMNMKALGPVCRNRDTAKTFIYAWLLGAGIKKISSILDCSEGEARDAVERFLREYPGLEKLKKERIPRDASRGYFFGLDGRPIICDSQHLMLAGYLQSGEAIVMKRATMIWKNKLEEEGIPYKLVDFVHDEWQTEVLTTDESVAKRVGELQVEAIQEAGEELGVLCPLDGEYRIGKNWKETH